MVVSLEPPEGFEPSVWRESADPGPVGRALGLKQRSLTGDCADFYILERLYAQLYEPVAWDPYTGRPTTYLPREFTSDTRRELLAIHIGKMMEDRVSELSQEIALYLSLACGGELRYMSAYMRDRFRRLGLRPTKCTHKKHTKECCPLRKNKEFGECKPGETGLWLKHNWHNHTCGKGGSGGKQGGYPKGSCSHGCCSHIHQPECYGKEDDIQLPEETLAFIDDLGGRVDGAWANVDRGGRAGGWAYWFTHFRHNPPHYMRRCQEVFDDSRIWGEGRVSVGGGKWAFVAGLAADYYEGKIKPRTFLDRCWTLQHNGGAIFNKFYPDMSGLQQVLVQQAADNYDSLASRASSPVREAYCDYESLSGRHIYSFQLKVGTGLEVIRMMSPGFVDWITSNMGDWVEGCLSCAAKTWKSEPDLVEEYTIYDPCYNGGEFSLEPNENCAYYGQEIEVPFNPGPEENDEGNHAVCGYCEHCVTCGECDGDCAEEDEEPYDP